MDGDHACQAVAGYLRITQARSGRIWATPSDGYILGEHPKTIRIIKTIKSRALNKLAAILNVLASQQFA